MRLLIFFALQEIFMNLTRGFNADITHSAGFVL